MEWTKYTTKEALKDNDELMILDTDGKANKRTLMDKIWNYVVDKMTTAVIAKLGTTNKTLIGAVNELNSNTAKRYINAFLNENETREFTLNNLSAYVLTVTYVGNSNISNGDIALVVTGGNSANTSKIIWITDNCYNHDWFSFDPDDGLKFKIALSTNNWAVISLTAL